MINAIWQNIDKMQIYYVANCFYDASMFFYKIEMNVWWTSQW